ncbi:macoilin-1 isoform X3 [Ctenocephalides felis]|uniref:macoilin-1 isoform X3 n=1 Tax=Ctenocephalides felis TaxID=7515 RepID=UPI000E6E1EF7|nr:macoilin-1 isoform X3 [Ctenocephalides felis]
MKRRNADCGKMRRPIKRNKITEGIYGSTLLYLKFLVLWALVILADFLLEFRFEFLWPFWLLLRSVHDSFKYQGLAFSVLFVCIALTSDLVCLFFIPVHWLFFAASTYVWVQYVWHTDKGVCLPTIILWMLFVYLEAAVRWRDLRHLPLHLDLCRPFAAHCIGYPVVTLGFGFKSYIGYRMRQRRQRDVAKENDFYLQILQQALPQETVTTPTTESTQQPPVQTKKASHTSNVKDVYLQNGHIGNGVKQHRKSLDKESSKSEQNGTIVSRNDKHEHHHPNMSRDHNHITKTDKNSDNSTKTDSLLLTNKCDTQQSVKCNDHLYKQDRDYNNKSDKNDNQTKETHNKLENHNHISKGENFREVVKNDLKNENLFIKENYRVDSLPKTESHVQNLNNASSQAKGECSNNRLANGSLQFVANGVELSERISEMKTKSKNINCIERRKGKERQHKEKEIFNNVCESCLRLDNEVRKLKSEVQSARQSEVLCKAQERSCRSELVQAQRESDELQMKVQSLTSLRQNERQNQVNTERKLAEERRQRISFENQLANERKQRKVAEDRLNKGECTESCKNRRQVLEVENKNLRRELQIAEERGHTMEQHGRALDQQVRNLEAEARARGQQHGADVLMGALAAMQDKNSHLEHSLSAETRIKLDLFSALGEANRKLEIKDNLIRAHEKELSELKSRLAQVLAVMPQDTFVTGSQSVGSTATVTSKLRLNDTPPLLSAVVGHNNGGSPLLHPINSSPSGNVQLCALNGITSNNNTISGSSLNHHQPGSTLDPNATAYTPKNSIGGEA